MSEHMDHEVLNYTYIADGIYIGTNMCCQVHFDERLVKEGIEADISLEGEQVDTPYGVQSYLWLPVEDETAPTYEQIAVGVSTLEVLVAVGKKVYVHCKNGHGRAPTLVAAYYIKQGKSVDEALQFIKEKRSVIHLCKVQREMLDRWEKSL